MLVLSRKEHEKLMIGNEITLIVRKISGGRVTLAIDAPKRVKIIRGELLHRALAHQQGGLDDQQSSTE